MNTHPTTYAYVFMCTYTDIYICKYTYKYTYTYVYILACPIVHVASTPTSVMICENKYVSTQETGLRESAAVGKSDIRCYYHDRHSEFATAQTGTAQIVI